MARRERTFEKESRQLSFRSIPPREFRATRCKMSLGMRWVRIFALFTALLALAVNAQCVAKCATAPCQAEKTPCHGHSAPQKAQVKPCGMAFVAVSPRAAAAQLEHQQAPVVVAMASADFSGVTPIAGRAAPSHAPPVRAVPLLSPI